LRIADLGRVDESREGFENNRDAKGDKEDGIEKGTQDLSTEPLGTSESADMFGPI